MISATLVFLALAASSVSGLPLSKRVDQTISDSTTKWVAACTAAGGGQQCNPISVTAFQTLLAAPGPCEQQNAADSMIDLAHTLNSDPTMIALTQIFVQQPRNSPTSLSVPYCQQAPKNAELNGLFQCQFQGVNPTTFVGNIAVGGAGTIPFGMTSPVSPPGSCLANPSGPIPDGQQLSDITQNPGVGGAASSNSTASTSAPAADAPAATATSTDTDAPAAAAPTDTGYSGSCMSMPPPAAAATTTAAPDAATTTSADSTDATVSPDATDATATSTATGSPAAATPADATPADGSAAASTSVAAPASTGTPVAPAACAAKQQQQRKRSPAMSIAKRIAQTDLVAVAQSWQNLCLVSGGDIQTNDPCVNLAGGAGLNALLAGADPCAQQDNADSMIDFANSANITNKDALIANAKTYRAHPRNALSLVGDITPSTPFCERAPRNSELNDIVNGQLKGVNLGLFGGPKFAVIAFGAPGTCPFGQNPDVSTCTCS